MKRVALIGALVVSLATASAAMAGPGGRGHGGGHDGYREGPRAHQEYRRDYRGDYRGDYRRDYRPGPRARVAYRAPVRYGVYQRPRGYYSHRWIRGERLPVAYYARPYVIADYGPYGLWAPPRGYHWVRVDGDAVLAAIATGIVLDTVFHAFH